MRTMDAWRHLLNSPQTENLLNCAAPAARNLRHTPMMRRGAGMAVTREPHLARYQLTGAVRGSGVQTRLLFRLADTESGRQLWAHRTDGLVCGDPAAEENLATRIAAALQPCLRSAEIERALQKPRVQLAFERRDRARHAARAAVHMLGHRAEAARLDDARKDAHAQDLVHGTVHLVLSDPFWLVRNTSFAA